MADQLHTGKELSDKKSNKMFECCKTKVVSVTVCIKCGKAFHKSCIERNNHEIIDETRIICCDDKQPKNVQGYLAIGPSGGNVVESTISDITSDNNTEKLQMEIDLLKKLIFEKDEKYKILWENKLLLDEKVKHLSDTSKKFSDDKNNKQAKKEDPNRNKTDKNPILTKTRMSDIGQQHNVNKTHKRIYDSGLRNDDTNGRESQYMESNQNMESNQHTAYTNIAGENELLNESLSSTYKDIKEPPKDEFTLVKNKKKERKLGKTRNKNIGSAEDSNEEFTGENPKLLRHGY
ncbi:hypothetical protein JTB14_023732 [Gonioctena quinquepunctata]|nr:hypothetical protein JTB14_023732 [Gonioctena quinquepunctata]